VTQELLDHHPALRVGDEVDLPARLGGVERAELRGEAPGRDPQVVVGVVGLVAAPVGGVREPVDLVGVIPERGDVEPERAVAPTVGAAVGPAVDPGDRHHEVAAPPGAVGGRRRAVALPAGPVEEPLPHLHEVAQHPGHRLVGERGDRRRRAAGEHGTRLGQDGGERPGERAPGPARVGEQPEPGA
jgi:hypothetical protein